MLIPSKHGRRLIYGGGYRQTKIKARKYLEENYKKYENYFADHPEFYRSIVEYYIGDKWFTKSSKYKKLRKKDISNYIKNLEDVLFSFIGIDDSSIVRYFPIEKVKIDDADSPELLCVIKILDNDEFSMRKMQDVKNDVAKRC